MSNKGKKVGAAPNLDDLGAAMSNRYATPTQEQRSDAPTTPQRTPTAESSTPDMTRRSWFLPTETADALSAAAGRLHHASQGRVSKSEALAALIHAGLEQEHTVAHRLGCDDTHS